MSKMKHPMHTAMRFGVYIRCLGAEPLRLERRTYRAYAIALQRQYDELRRTVDPATARQAKSAGRALIRQHTFRAAAGDLFPAQPSRPAKVHLPEVPADEVLAVSEFDGQSWDTSRNTENTEGSTMEPALPKPKDMWNCRRKIRHSDYLSAMKHASRFAKENLDIYPCIVCGGMHVGHDPSSDKVQERKKARRELNLIAKRLEVLNREKRQLEEQKLALIAEQAKTPAGTSQIELHRSLREFLILFFTRT